MTVPAPRDSEGLLAYTRQALYKVWAIAAAVFVPFLVNSLVQQRYALGSAILGSVAIFAANAVATRAGRRPPVPALVLLAPIAAAMTISLKTQGIYGAFWCYPTVIFFYFVLSRRVAHACNVALLIYTTFIVTLYVGSDVAIRFAVSLGLVVVIMSTILNILDGLQGQLVEQTIRDPLTGAYNRRHMEFSLSAAIERCRRTAEPASLVLFDIDHFKRVNDELGHAAGDEVLKGLVQVVMRRARKMDLLFRIGGEEFILLLAGARQADALAVAESLRLSVAEAPLVNGRKITISLGVSELQVDQSVDQWIKQADAAMYQAKQDGRNRVAGATLSTTAV